MKKSFVAKAGFCVSAVSFLSVIFAAGCHPPYSPIYPVPLTTLTVTPTPSAGPTTYVYDSQWTGLFTPTGLSIDNSQNIYVSDSDNNRIVKFNPQGTPVATWGTSGANNAQFDIPEDVAVSGTTVYVADDLNSRIQYFDLTGGYLGQWGTGQASGNGQFTNPFGVGVDGSGYIYVLDQGNHRIQKFDSSHQYVSQWSVTYPESIAVTGSGSAVSIYVTLSTQKVQVYDGDGNIRFQFGTTGAGKFSTTGFPQGIALDSAGNVFVNDSYGNRIEKFDAQGNFIMAWGGPQGSGDGMVDDPLGIAVDSAGKVYVADTFNNRIEIFRPN